MKIPNRKSTQFGLIAFGTILVCATGLAWVELRSVVPVIVLVIGIIVLWQISRVALHTQILDNDLISFQAFTTRSIPLANLKKIVVDSSDEGTVTLYFIETKLRLMQRARTTRGVISQILAERSDVELCDNLGWLSAASEKS